ncbi:hypothetical protein pdam_00010355 [Pocillopora damicornis]|uniref:Uncharacterized protein n=1 Tax=Pocillopora damicornis TaxID=46731 RepID=A0A3M6UFC2_POCDA|nr:hypothetical protein pdam_00010355 [Pocillopora damicornis]
MSCITVICALKGEEPIKGGVKTEPSPSKQRNHLNGDGSFNYSPSKFPHNKTSPMDSSCNRPHFLSGYCRNNPRGMFGELERTFVSHERAFWFPLLSASKTLYEITLTNEVRVPLYKLRTEFFPLRVCASYKSESKKQGSVAVQTERTGFK